jgi:hypothetical protein
MPNWCDNSIYIESDEETIAEIKLAIKESRLLQYMHPMPAELEGTTAPNEGVNWYSWLNGKLRPLVILVLKIMIKL